MARTQWVLGIDVAKDSLVIYDTQTTRHCSIANNQDAIELACKERGWSAKTHIVGLESTGDYSLLPMKLFMEAGYTVRLLNPILTQAGIQRTVRGTKTDASDSKLIAELTAKGEGQLVTKQSLEMGRKALVRTEQKLTNMAADLKRTLKTLKQKQAAGVNVDKTITVVDNLIDQIDAAKTNLWEIAKDPTSQTSLARQEAIIDSHVGCGTKLATIISEEAGDIKRFQSARQLVAYAGIDPKVIQSGNLDVRGRMTKRGNNNLRHALYLAANVARMHDPQLKQYFEQKRKDGKHYTVAVCAVARKMCHRIYATVTEDRLYEKREPESEKPYVVKGPDLPTITA